MIRILVVVPYKELQVAFEQAIATVNHDGIQFTTTHISGTSQKLIDTLEGDIIVARGITATAIARQKPNSHVIPIALGNGDLLMALSLAKQESGPTCHIGLITNEDLCASEYITKLVGCPVSVHKVFDQSDVYKAVIDLRSKGCTVLVGGLTMADICEKEGFAYIHMKTGEQAIVHAIEEAMATARSLERARTRGNLLETLLNNANYALFATNNYGTIIAGNHQAELLFGRPSLEGLSIDEIYKDSTWSQTIEAALFKEELKTLNGQKFLVTQQPLTVDSLTSGILFTFQNAEDIQKTEHKIRIELNRKGLVAKYSFKDIITQNSQMLNLLDKAKHFSTVNGPVLLIGETGTGKELFAQSLHNNSPRRNEPFVAVNCAALPETLLESELFGYADGAFTGAAKGGKVGLFELAHKGTLFLDEIGEMPLVLQAKLLRVLQEKEIRKIGADKVTPIDVRIITAANSNILDRAKNNDFRLDLFYRISLLILQIPSLRERKDDIDLLFRHFVRQYCTRHGQYVPTISDEAVEFLQQFYWPGNIRELRNAAERLAILNRAKHIGIKEIEQLDIDSISLYRLTGANTNHSKRVLPPSATDEELFEQFTESGMTREDFAQKVGVSRTTLWRKFSKFS